MALSYTTCLDVATLRDSGPWITGPFGSNVEEKLSPPSACNSAKLTPGPGEMTSPAAMCQQILQAIISAGSADTAVADQGL